MYIYHTYNIYIYIIHTIYIYTSYNIYIYIIHIYIFVIFGCRYLKRFFFIADFHLSQPFHQDEPCNSPQEMLRFLAAYQSCEGFTKKDWKMADCEGIVGWSACLFFFCAENKVDIEQINSSFFEIRWIFWNLHLLEILRIKFLRPSRYFWQPWSRPKSSFFF